MVVGIFIISKTAGSGPADETKPLAVSKEVSGVEVFKIVGREHVPAGTTVTTYNSNPPTSGPHWNTLDPRWPAPISSGVYDHTLYDEQLIHNLEHGYIWISYIPAGGNPEASVEASLSAQKPGISPDELKKLEQLVNGDNWKMIMEPRPKDDSTIALAAWGRVLKMDSLDIDKIKAFIQTYRNRGPEDTPS